MKKANQIVLFILFSLLVLDPIMGQDKLECSAIWPAEQLAILPSSEFIQYKDQEANKPSRISAKECSILDSIVHKAISDNIFTFLKDPSIETLSKSYYIQLVPYIDSNDHKVVFMNAFCQVYLDLISDTPSIKLPKDWWKENLVRVHDGGYCYWQMKLDLTNRNYFDFFENDY